MGLGTRLVDTYTAPATSQAAILFFLLFLIQIIVVIHTLPIIQLMRIA